MNQDMWAELHLLFKERILEKTADEWKKTVFLFF